MSNNQKQLATVVTMAGIGANMNVSMDDVVSHFVSKYEDGLLDERTVEQAKMAALTKDIKALAETALVIGKSELTNQMNVTNFANSLVKIETTLKLDDVRLDWSEGQITFAVSTKMTGLLASKNQYHKTDSAYVDGQWPIPAASVVKYNDLMNQKQVCQEKLVEINNNLRDVGRKERKVRGVLAERKLNEMGMTELLADPSIMLALTGPVETK